MSEIPHAPMSEADLKAAQESRAKRRADFAKMVQDAGLDPSQIDVTKIMDDQEQADVIAHMAANKRAKELAGEVGRKALKERLKSSLMAQQSCVERTTLKFPKADEKT